MCKQILEKRIFFPYVSFFVTFFFTHHIYWITTYVPKFFLLVEKEQWVVFWLLKIIIALIVFYMIRSILNLSISSASKRLSHWRTGSCSLSRNHFCLRRLFFFLMVLVAFKWHRTKAQLLFQLELLWIASLILKLLAENMVWFHPSSNSSHSLATFIPHRCCSQNKT